MRKDVRISQERQMSGDDSFASSLANGESFMQLKMVLSGRLDIKVSRLVR